MLHYETVTYNNNHSMKKNLLLFSVFIFLISCGTKESYDLAIQDVTIFESQHQTILYNKTILIKNDTIAEIINADEKIFAKKIIDGKGRLLTSGFIDTHIHLRQMLDLAPNNPPEVLNDTYRKKLSEKMLSYGTTTVLDMGQPESWMPITIDWQKKPSPDYPNYFITGAAMISKGNRASVHQIVVENPVEKIQEYDSIGSGFIKLYSKLNLDDMDVLVKEAKKKNMNMYAHTEGIGKVTIPQAMEVGVKDFEHFFTVLPSVLDYKVHWDLMEKRFGLNPYNHIDDWSAYMLFFFQYIKENPELDKKLLKLLDQMAENKATISTTIHVLAAAAEETSFFSSFDHFPIRDKPEFPDYTSQQRLDIKMALETMLSYLKIAHEKGIMIRIGTDNRQAGQSVISEFNLLSKAGFSIEDILQIATWNGAKAMNLDNMYGSVKIGYKADLVLFSENPFDDYKNFNSEKTIIKGGKEYIPKLNVIPHSLKSINDIGINKTIETIENDLTSYEGYELIEIGYHLLYLGKVEEGKRILAFTSEKYADLNEIYIENTLAKIGSSLISQDLSEKSIEVFELITEKFPDSFQAFNYLGQVYSLVSKDKDAIKAYKRAIELNQENEFGIEQLKKLENK